MFTFEQFPVLQSDRLYLDEISEHDIRDIMALFGDPEVTKFNDVETFTSDDDARWLIRFLRGRFAEKIGVRWAIRLQHDQRLIGTCGYNYWARHNNSAEIGYDMRQDQWKNGYTTEAVRAVLQFGFDKMRLNRVEADVLPGNHASVRVLEKLNFKEEGLLRQRGFWEGKYHDLRLFSLLRSEWMA